MFKIEFGENHQVGTEDVRSNRCRIPAVEWLGDAAV
jgi:hypothetical protein